MGIGDAMVLEGVRNKPAGIFAIIGGALIFFGGGIGIVNLLTTAQNYVEQWFPGNEQLQLIFRILIVIASLGGIAVIIGGILIWKNLVFIGKIFIFLGAGIGLIGLLIGMGIAWFNGKPPDIYFLEFTSNLLGIGIVLSILASFLAKG